MTGRSSDSKIRSPPWGSFPAGYHPFAHEPLPTLGRNATLSLSATPGCGLDATKKLLSKGPVRPAKHGQIACIQHTHAHTPHVRTTLALSAWPVGRRKNGHVTLCIIGAGTESPGTVQSSQSVQPLQVQSHHHRHGRVNKGPAHA
jgi:hypothetical protein